MTLPPVTVVVPNWNGATRLPALFHTLLAQRPIHEIIVVDNGSTDASLLLSNQAGARVIPLPRNAGFAHAVNRGMSACRTDWAAILNNDVTLQPDWLETILTKALASEAPFATGKLLDASHPTRIDGTYDAVSRGATAWRCGAGQPDSPPYNQPAPVQFPSFTAILIQTKHFQAAAGLDEQYESYLEDVDFGFRAARLHLTGIYVPDAVGYHQGSATLGRWNPATVRRISRNQLLLAAKHYPAQYAWNIFIAQLLWGLLALRHARAYPWLLGKIEGLRAFRAARNPLPNPAIHQVLATSEQQLKDLQRHSTPDLYWRLYFALT